MRSVNRLLKEERAAALSMVAAGLAQAILWAVPLPNGTRYPMAVFFALWIVLAGRQLVARWRLIHGGE